MKEEECGGEGDGEECEEVTSGGVMGEGITGEGVKSEGRKGELEGEE